MAYTIWYSTESFADFIIDHTQLRHKACTKAQLFESDANKSRDFHTLPDHIKQIMYLDAPDLIVEWNSEPIFSVEISRGAMTGHDPFQRFARLAAAVEHNVPAFYILSEAKIITRAGRAKWDTINPLVFMALEAMMSIYNIPALLHYYSSDYLQYPSCNDSPNAVNQGLIDHSATKYAACPSASDGEIVKMFQEMDTIIQIVEKDGIHVGIPKLLAHPTLRRQRDWMQSERVRKNAHLQMSPLSTVQLIDTEYLLNHLQRHESTNYQVGSLLRSRPQTIIYVVDSKFRGDPYPGALAAIDYLKCRTGKTFEDRQHNLVLAWGSLTMDNDLRSFEVVSAKCSVADFVQAVQGSESKNLLTRDYDQLRNHEIPRYYMQARYGSMFSKVKHIRVYSYFADAILFCDGALWRDA